jgi:hypothetical protein
VLKHAEMKKLSLATAWLVVGISALLANSCAWQTGVPGTGSASASNHNRKTDVAIENENLKIDLHPEYAVVEVHYRMHNNGVSRGWTLCRKEKLSPAVESKMVAGKFRSLISCHRARPA